MVLEISIWPELSAKITKPYLLISVLEASNVPPATAQALLEYSSPRRSAVLTDRERCSDVEIDFALSIQDPP
jgi:hypothetical protein